MLPSRAAALLDALPGRGAALLARAPGRVNLIGEHTDYNGLPVLPIAIDRDVLVAARRRDDDHVDLSNTGAAFPPRQYAVAAAIPPSPAGDWANYAKAAAEALVADLGRRGLGALPGGAFRVDGRVPLAAGLSSSSALLVACGLAHLSLAGVALPPAELAELFACAERYVGTLSGGMDQATALLARADHALRIDFFPLRARPVTIPASAVFVVAQSLERAEKSGAARGHYNQRVTECGLACAVLAQRLGVAAARLGDLPGPERVLDDLDRLLPEDARREMLPALTGLAPRELDRRFFAPGTVLAAPGRFELRRRVRHVLGEAARVAAAEEALGTGDLETFGALMDASHRSCATDYGVSTPALDRLVAVARGGGALGARLTGAGFGGAIVALVEQAHVDRLVRTLDREFYAAGSAPPEARLVVRPAAAASVERVAS